MKMKLTQMRALLLIAVLYAAISMAPKQAEARATINIAGHPSKGLDNAPITLVVYSDYLSDECKQLELILRQIQEKYPIELKLVYKFIPTHTVSLKAAAAALAADEQGKFWEFHDKIFENKNTLNEANIYEIAKDLKLNMAQFGKRMNGSAHNALIHFDHDEAKRLGINTTPSVYISGRHVEKPSFENLVSAIENDLDE